MSDTKPKRYEFLKTVPGSRDGLTVSTFQRGEVHELDESLAEQFFHQGVITETTKPAGGHLTDADPAPSSDSAGEAGIPLRTQRIEELVSVARDHYGLDVDTTMTRDQVISMIKAAGGKTADPTAEEIEGAGDADAPPPVEEKATGPAQNKALAPAQNKAKRGKK